MICLKRFGVQGISSSYLNHVNIYSKLSVVTVTTFEFERRGSQGKVGSPKSGRNTMLRLYHSVK